MADNSLKNKLVKGNKVTATSGLHARIAAAQMLNEQVGRDITSLPNRVGLICDFSGSMDSAASYSSSNTKTKLELLKDAVQDFGMRMDSYTTAIAVESFPEGFRINMTNDHNEVWLKMMQIRTLGDTPMGRGMHSALAEHKPTRCVLISDGEATDGEASYDAARIYKEREIICDTVHIGESKNGEERLKKIAEITGGMYMKFSNVANFAASLHFLLPDQRASIAGMLPYDRAKLLGADESK